MLIHKSLHNLLDGLWWTIKVPLDARLISVGCQDPEAPHLSVWYQFSDHYEKGPFRSVEILAVETGKRCLTNLERWEYLSTVIMREGRYVVHVYTRTLLEEVTNGVQKNVGRESISSV
jgi:hypothetical protein